MSDIKKWAIVSWQYEGALDSDFGKLLEIFEGTYDDACIYVRKEYLPKWSPVSLCGIIEP